MSIHDYLQKHAQHARTLGIRRAGVLAASEASHRVLDALNVYERRETPIWHTGDWDICLVLDATRHDAFQTAAQDHNWLPDTPESIWSVGSMSPEWIGETFQPAHQEDWQDCGYVTANPFSSKPVERAAGAPPGSLPLESPPLGYLDEVWRTAWEDEPISTVPPEVVMRRTLHAWQNRDEYGLDCVVGHAMQPHIPFRSRPEWFGARHDLEYFGEPEKDLDGETDIWIELKHGRRTRDEVWAAYLDNLHWALEWVDWLRQRTSARIAVTSDHGNGMGERGVYSHPPRSQAPVLRRVPWVVVEGTNELAVDEPVPGSPPDVETDVSEEDRVREQLAALGYTDA